MRRSTMKGLTMLVTEPVNSTLGSPSEISARGGCSRYPSAAKRCFSEPTSASTWCLTRTRPREQLDTRQVLATGQAVADLVELDAHTTGLEELAQVADVGLERPRIG